MATKPLLDSRYETPEPPLRLEAMFKFQQRVFGDMTGALGTLAAFIGDRLGLFRALAESGPVTVADFARARALDPAMAAEWLQVMACTGYVEFDGTDATYRLPPEHAMVLANDAGPMCLAGGLQQFGAFAERVPDLLDAFRAHSGVPQAAYSNDLREGMERLSATWFEQELVDHWIAALPAVADRLRSGGSAADVGCGGGRALIRLASAFPASRFVGYDAFPGSVERATRNAAAANVGERVRFEVRDVTQGLNADFDLVTAFDSLHDMADPAEGLAALARGLKKDGTLLVLELDAGEFGDGPGPVGVIHHATKLFYNLPVALAAYGHAPETTSFPEATMRALCRRAGLIFERTLPVRNPLHKLYVIKRPPH